MDDKEKARDKRYRKTYDWTLDRVNRLSEVQGGKCGICGRPPKPGGAGLNLDHEHFSVYVFPASRPTADLKWVGLATFKDGRQFEEVRKTKAAAVAAVRAVALPHSVRGLLCPGRNGRAGHGCCNRLLGRVDCIPWLEKAIKYLKDPPALKVFPNGQTKESAK